MREFAGKTAFVTGGAAGIGLALGRAFAQSGMKVMLADIEADALQAAIKSLQEISPDIVGTICDVADAESVDLGERTARVEILEHLRGDKIHVYKYKPKKDYRKKTGHRQELTRIRILEVSEGT